MHLVWVCGCQQVSQHSYSTLTFKVPTYLSHRPLSCRGCQAHARVGACLGVPGPASALGRACASGLRVPPPCPRPPSCLPCSRCVLSRRVSRSSSRAQGFCSCPCPGAVNLCWVLGVGEGGFLPRLEAEGFAFLPPPGALALSGFAVPLPVA